MVDQKSGTYRPRRALIEPDVEPAQPERPARPGHNGNGHANGANGRGRPDPVEGHAATGSTRKSPRSESDEGRTAVGPTRLPPRPAADEDHPKPLYREETRPNGLSRPAFRAASPADPPTQETMMTPANLAPRRPPSTDDETTTILPRSRPTKHRTQALDAIDDYDDDDARRPLGQGVKLALIIGVVAVVVVIGLLIGFAVRGAANQPPNQTSQPPPSDGASNGGNQPSAPSGKAVLTDAAMLNPNQAKAIDPNRTWKVNTTQQGATEDGPTAACFGGEPLQGQPTPQQESVRVLKGGKNTPVALHAATAYSSPEEAGVAYAIASKTLGGCAVTGYYVESGRRVSGIGDQAVGAVVMHVQGKEKSQAHSVILNRTGRVVNVIDAYQPSKAIAIGAVATAMGQVNGALCAAAGGKCGTDASVKEGPPPLGGDEPGFLALGDLPPAGPEVNPWVAASLEPPAKGFKGSGCESVNWSTEPAKSRISRTYMMESGADFFGVDEIVLTTKNAQAASRAVNRIKSSTSDCKGLSLTADVSKPKKVTSIGDQKTKIAGWTFEVRQKTTQGRVRYRVGIVSAGSKVIYTFANPRGEYDFTDKQWDTIAVRAGERTTQVP